MTRDRFDSIVSRLESLTLTTKISRITGKPIDWVEGEKFKPSDTDATLDELREVGRAYGLYLHHCSHCDSWYFAWFETLEEARRTYDQATN